MVDFSFPTGAEAAYRRPAVVASNDGANRSTTTLGRGVVTVVPVTGNVHGIYPFQVRPATRACCLLRDSKAHAPSPPNVSTRVSDECRHPKWG